MSTPAYDLGPLFRQTDPVTSREAARKIAPKLTESRLAVLRAHAEHGAMDGPTAENLPEFASGWGASSVRCRQGDLRKMGFLRRVGKGDRGHILDITDAGRRALG